MSAFPHPAEQVMERPKDALRFEHHAGTRSFALYVEDSDSAFVCDVDIDTETAERASMTVKFWPGAMRTHYFLPIHAQVKQLIREAHEHGIRRIQWAVDAGEDKAHRWAAVLGFKPEGLMRCYAGGRDYVLYARVVNRLEARERETA